MNDESQLALSPGIAQSDKLNHLDKLLGIFVYRVVCGWSHSIALGKKSLNSESLVFVWGSNSYNQLGLGQNMRSAQIPIIINKLTCYKIKKVVCGLRHSGAITEDGILFLWGENSHGQCGFPNSQLTLSEPNKFEFEDQILDASLGSRHSMICTSKKKIYCFGENRFGQCGCESKKDLKEKIKQKNLILKPYKVITFEEGSNLSLRSGWNHNLILVKNENCKSTILLSFGRNNYGQLGRTTKEPYDYHPLPINFESQLLKDVCCGSEHNLCLTETGQVWSWGWNEHGQLGQMNEINQNLPKLIESIKDEKVSKICCGNGFSFAISCKK